MAIVVLMTLPMMSILMNMVYVAKSVAACTDRNNNKQKYKNMDTFDKIEAMLAELLEQANDQKKNSGKLSSKLDGIDGRLSNLLRPSVLVRKFQRVLSPWLTTTKRWVKFKVSYRSGIVATRITSSCTKSFKLNNLIGLQKNGPSRLSVGFMTNVTNGYGLSISCLP